MNTPEEYIAAMEPKFCINCKHIGRNGSGDPTKYKCFAPQNVSSKGTDLVTGEQYKLYYFTSCYDARASLTACSPSGEWFEAAPEKFCTVVSGPAAVARAAKPTTATVLLDQLNSL